MGFSSVGSTRNTVKMLMPKRHRSLIYEYLFKEGVLVAMKDTHLAKHPEIDVPNLHVMKALLKSFNRGREAGEKYSDDILTQLVQRYEAPISHNRWDSPLFLVLRDGQIDSDGIYDGLFNKKAPPPNQSTQNAPLSSTNFVYELDKQTQAVISAVMDAQKTSGAGSEVFIPGTKEKVYLQRTYTLAELTRTKRQFLVFAKQKSCHDVSKLSTMFVQYINANLTD